jgi:hypothetical protein
VATIYNADPGVGGVHRLRPAGACARLPNAGHEPARHVAIASPADAMTIIEEAFQAEPAARPAVFARYRSHLLD